MKYQAKVMVEAYVWLECDDPRQALFIAADINGIQQGPTLRAHCNDAEVCGAEAVDLFEVSDVPGAVKNKVELRTNSVAILLAALKRLASAPYPSSPADCLTEQGYKRDRQEYDAALAEANEVLNRFAQH